MFSEDLFFYIHYLNVLLTFTYFNILYISFVIKKIIQKLTIEFLGLKTDIN